MRISLLLYLLTGLAASAQTVWTVRTSTTATKLYRPAGKPGVYLVPTDGTNPEGDKTTYLRSTDGVAWIRVYLPHSTSLACYNNRFVSYQRQAEPAGVWYSDDGTSAVTATITGATPAEISSFSPTGIAYGNSVWIITGANGQVLRSTDNAVTWEYLPTPAAYLGPIVFGAGVFVAYAGRASLISADGITWNIGPDIPGVEFQFAGKFLTKTHGSPDGMIWSELQGPEKPPLSTFELVRAGGDNSVLAWSWGDGPARFYHYENGAWQGPFASNAAEYIPRAAQCGDLWIAVTDHARILTSPTPALPPPAAPPLTIAPALKLSWPSESGRSYVIQRSTDQTAWTDQTGVMRGTGATMEWLAPASAAKEFFRVQVR